MRRPYRFINNNYKKNLSVNQDIFAAFIDLQKAFDFVDIKIVAI